MRFLKVILPILVLVGSVAVFQYLNSSNEPPVPLSITPQIPVVKMQPATHVSASPSLTLFGQVEAPGLANLTAAVEADVIEVSVSEGDTVSQGQRLLVMDDSDIVLAIEQRQAEIAEIIALIEDNKIKHQYDRAAVEQERSLLNLARKAVKRAERLANSQAGSEATLDNALRSEQQQLLSISQRQRSIAEFAPRQQQFEARLTRAKVGLKRDRMDQQRTLVTAPFSGRIRSVSVSKGDRVNRGSQLFQMYDEQSLEIRAQIPNRYLPIIQSNLGKPGSIQATTLIAGHWVQLELDRLSASVSQGQGGVDGFFKLPPVPTIQLGRTLEIVVQLPTLHNVVVVPVDAIYGRDRVYLIKAGVLEGKAVERLGHTWTEEGEQQLILLGSTFQPDDKILISRLPQAVEGLAVDGQHAAR